MKYVRKLTPVHSYDIPGPEELAGGAGRQGTISQAIWRSDLHLYPRYPTHGPLPSGLLQYPTGILTPSPVCSPSTVR